MTGLRTTVHAAGARGGRRPARRRRSGGARKRPAQGRSPRGAGRKQAQRWWPAGLVGAAVLVALAWRADAEAPEPHEPPAATPTCALPGSAITITPEQAANASIIAGVAWDRGLPDRAVVIALATAQQESGLRNLDYGDRDSLGLFQQRPSMGWGTEAQVQDPVYAAGKFLDHLVQVPNWNTRPLAEASDAVQRSAYPHATAKHEAMAIDLTAALRSGGGHLDCS
jgi:hypothetical protein